MYCTLASATRRKEPCIGLFACEPVIAVLCGRRICDYTMSFGVPDPLLDVGVSVAGSVENKKLLQGH